MKVPLLLKSFLRIICGVIIGVTLVLYPLLYFLQEKLIFRTQSIEEKRYHHIKKNFPNSEVQILTPDGVKLHGWLVKSSQATNGRLLIYFGGNSEEVSWFLDNISYLKGWSLLLMNYRGYGLSEGSPSEKNLFQDALLIYDKFSKREEVDKKRIVVMGRSLGTGVGVFLASRRPLQGIILVSPYDSLQSLAKNIYPYVPVSLLSKHPFDSISRVSNIKIPLVALFASNDRVVPPKHSKKLIEKWKGPKQFHEFKGYGHNSITLAKKYWPRITEFLASLE